VLLKNFALKGQPVETRLLRRHPDGTWAGYTYEWNTAGTQATRVIGGKSRTVNGQTGLYPSENDCMRCHTPTAGFSLGAETAQLNGHLIYPTTNRTANQLTTLAGIGMFSAPLPGAPASLPALPDPTDSSLPLGNRARAYLHTNCSQCHRPSGPTPSSMDLRYTTPLATTNICDVTPQSGSLGIANARLIAPGDAARSIVIARMNRRDAQGMPPLGSNQVDATGVSLLTAWVNSLAGC
jgi:mono/diheme cytochrome c family protein